MHRKMNAANEIRRRKNKDNQNGRPVQKRKHKHVKSTTGIQQSLLCLILSGVMLTSFVVLYTDNIPWHVAHRAADKIATTFGYYEPVHAIVIDAGSTGSRILAFTFHKAVIDGHLVLDKELFEYTKPGLSAFADTPKKAIESISGLINKAKNEIPEQYWNKTPIILKATAGLRLLPAEKAEGLLQAMRQLFKQVPFLSDDNSIGIMDGTDEGIFSWFTVNFLLNNVQNPSRTVAALDLGGGSTQVTFSAMTPATLQEKEFVHEALLPKGSTPVYTNSYLGLGLMAARKEIITYSQGNRTQVISKCVNPIVINKKFHYGGLDYYVSGNQKNFPTKEYTQSGDSLKEHMPIVDFEECSKIVKDYVLTKARPPVELANKKIFAFSYYFDRASESSLIDERYGGIVPLDKFRSAAKEVCDQANTDQPFMCLDLTFISVLLQHGLGLPNDTNIFLYKKIDGHEISWALGAAFNMLQGRK